MTSDTVTSATKATRTPASKGASRAVNQAASKAPAKVAKKAAKEAVQKAVKKAAKEVAKKAPAKSITKTAGKSSSAPPAPAAPKPWHVVRRSPLHGNGVFAARKIPAGTRVMEYIGERISAKEADRRHPTNPDDPFHTFFFALSSGKVIDGGVGGNDARWINHSCTPNCESQEGRAGKRLYIVTLRDIARGEELFYDYGLVLDGKITKALKEGYKCLCGTPACRGTMLALPEKKKKKKQGARSAA